MSDGRGKKRLKRHNFPLPVGRSTDLSQILKLDRTGSGDILARIHSYDGFPGLYGGEIAAQALMAAMQTVAEDRSAHALHVSFLRPGNVALPVFFEVDRDHDGRSFSKRRIVARQGDQCILTATVSFHVDESGIEHQTTMPVFPAPEDFVTDTDLPEPFAIAVTNEYRMRPRTIRIREAVFPDAVAGDAPCRAAWLRASTPLADYRYYYRGVLPYMSDVILETALQPHDLRWGAADLMTTSLDHNIWFHGVDLNEDWLLFVQDSPIARGARTLTRGQFFTRAGKLIASVAQEGLVRVVA